MRARLHTPLIPLAMVLAAAALTAQSVASNQSAGPALTAVRGRVVAADGDARPLRNARVVVSGVEGEPVFTSSEGEFIAPVPRLFTLRITKAGFAPMDVRGTAAATAETLQIPLHRGAALVGVVVDELGFRVTDARIHARWIAPAAAGGVTDFYAETDDAGEYRIGSLPAGRYTVNTLPALPRMTDTAFDHEAFSQMQAMRRLVEMKPPNLLSDLVGVELRAGEETPVTLMHRRRAVDPADAPIAGAVSGVVLDEYGEPVEGITVRPFRVRFIGGRSIAQPAGVPWRTDDHGRYRLSYLLPGRYVIAASDDEAAYASIYFPGTTNVANASPVTVGRKEEILGANLVFSRTREARVSGVALSAGGGPLEGAVSLMAIRRAGATALPAVTTKTDASGRFEFLNVPPGDYVLRAMRQLNDALESLKEFGLQRVTVTGPDVPPVTITAVLPVTIGGRVVFEGEPSRVADDVAVTAIGDPDDGPLGTRPYTARRLGGGLFEFVGGVAGVVRIVAVPPSGWWVKSIDFGGIDIGEEPIRVAGRADSRSEITVVLSPGAASLSGRVADDAGAPVDDYRVIVFSANPQRWFIQSPYVRLAAGPELDGGFALRGLAPGDYWIIALDKVEGDGAAGEWQNPDVLADLANAATRISLSQGQRATVQLRVVKR